MKSRKTIAILTAVVMMVLPMQVAFAADPADTIVDGDAIVNYVDPTSITSIVVPTENALDFTLDPQNLAATQGVGAWKPEDGGSIIPAAVCILGNKSAVPIKTSVHLTLTDDAKNVVLLNSADNVNTGLDKNMYLSFVPANAKTSINQNEIAATTEPAYLKNGETVVEFDKASLLAAGVKEADLLASTDANTAGFGAFVETGEDTDKYHQVEVPKHDLVAATTVTSVSGFSTLAVPAAAAKLTSMETGADLAFAMDKADYYVAKAGTGYSLKYDGAARNDNFDTASFIISGVINKNANWSGYDADTKISVKATYTFDIMTDADYTAAITGKVLSTHNSLETVPPVAPAVVPAESLAIEAGTAEDVAVTLGSGSLAATGVASVTYEDAGTKTVAAENYTFSGTTLTFKSAFIDTLIAANVASREFTVTFNNTAGTTGKVTLTYASGEAPSITEETAAIAASTAEDFTVSLGTEGSAATGITSVTYEDSGTKTLVADTDYTFAGTTLSFTSAYVNSLISAHVESREFTVTFNNTAATTDKVTLTYTVPTDAAPSIATTSYKFTSGSPVAVPVSLGSGSLAATGITSVTYVGTTGATKTLVITTDYALADNTLTFTTAFINSLVTNGVASREFTVNFNDTAKTAVKVTLHS